MRLRGSVFLTRERTWRRLILQKNKLSVVTVHRRALETNVDPAGIFESDRGRIINSPAIRRLQQPRFFHWSAMPPCARVLPTQMEVQQVGRYIAKEILSRLKELKLLEAYGLDELTGPFESIVEMSCLMHDIGNPPFGHFGEAAMNDWFRQQFAPGRCRKPASD